MVKHVNTLRWEEKKETMKWKWCFGFEEKLGVEPHWCRCLSDNQPDPASGTPGRSPASTAGTARRSRPGAGAPTGTRQRFNVPPASQVWTSEAFYFISCEREFIYTHGLFALSAETLAAWRAGDLELVSIVDKAEGALKAEERVAIYCELSSFLAPRASSWFWTQKERRRHGMQIKGGGGGGRGNLITADKMTGKNKRTGFWCRGELTVQHHRNFGSFISVCSVSFLWNKSYTSCSRQSLSWKQRNNNHVSTSSVSLPVFYLISIYIRAGEPLRGRFHQAHNSEATLSHISEPGWGSVNTT